MGGAMFVCVATATIFGIRGRFKIWLPISGTIPFGQYILTRIVSIGKFLHVHVCVYLYVCMCVCLNRKKFFFSWSANFSLQFHQKIHFISSMSPLIVGTDSRSRSGAKFVSSHNLGIRHFSIFLTFLYNIDYNYATHNYYCFKNAKRKCLFLS